MTKYTMTQWKHRPPKKGKKDELIARLREQNEELTKGLMFAMTLIPKDKLPNGFTPSSFFWLKGQGRKLEYDDPSDIGIDFKSESGKRKTEEELYLS